MGRILKLIQYIKKYKSLILGNVISNILMVVFSIISIPLMIPFLEMLLGKDQLVLEKVPLTLSTDAITNNFYYYLSQIVQNHGKEQALIWICSILVGIYFFKNLFRYLSLFFLAPVRNGIVRDIRQQLFKKTMSLPLSYFSEERKGDLISRVTADVQEIEWSILNVLESIVREPLMMIGALSLMIILSPSLTVFVLVLIVFTAVVIGGIGKALKRQSSEVQERLGNLVSMLEESLSGLRIIKAFNAEDRQANKFKAENNQYKNLLTKLLWRRDLSSPVSEFLGITIVMVLIWYGFKEVQSGSLSVAGFLAFLYAFYSVIEPAKKFSSASYNIQKGIGAVERVEKILKAENTIREIDHPKPLSKFTKSVEFESVGFHYKKEDGPVLQDINLSIPKGKSVALVGPSGAGKTTIADLLPRFYDVTNGAIKIDGVDIRELGIHNLRSLMGIVSQEAILFNDTIFNNITFGLKEVKEESVINAAKIANAHDFIMANEMGYQTNIGDRGMKLSGGQRQRITIARAILADPEILILDEATSALDSESEKLVQEALTKLLKNRTSLVIAHRLSTIQNADEIIVMNSGKIVERGKHQALLNQGGDYSKLVALQGFS